ncbi:hypothetical protein VE02_05285 [Pseudogymnoascus sp. 03VT05]|nr:hypothetical protein VE02_05285 [Pseudogymnoascus sp. 03VT05]
MTDGSVMADPLSATASIIAVLQLSSTVLRYLVDVKEASADRKSLIHEISSTRGILSTLNETVVDARVGPLNVLTTTLQSLATTLKDSALATGIRKTVDSLRWPFKQGEVDKILRVIERQKSTLSLALDNDHIALSREIRNNTEAIRDDVAGLSRELAAAQLDAKNDAESLKHNAILSQLPCADGAPFNAFRRDYERDCLPGTRVELLNEITTWGNTSDGPCIFWLSGTAGTGKSTIARTVARHFADQRRLGASFFFSRGQGDLGHAEKFFPTIASQIAHTMPSLKRHICEAVTEDYQVGSQGLREQWEKLVFLPLSKMKNTLLQRLPIILVIDALDECERENREDDTRVILGLLAKAKDLPTIQLRIFLTSRPEVSVSHSFSAMSNFTHQDRILHHTSKGVIERDISAFILFEFERIKKKRGLLSDWPKVEDINSLVRDANGLFIYAATISRFVDRRNPEKQLSIILQYKGSSPPTLRKSHTQSLDEIYYQVLKSAIFTSYDEEDREEVLDLFKQTIGSIVILSDTLSTNALTSLLGLQIGEVDEIIKQLLAILDVPDDLGLPVRLLHPSFRDFLLDKNRCKDLNFWIDESQTHRMLADRCIQLMSNFLKQDVCTLEAPGTLVNDVEGNQIEQRLPPEVKYACRYWIQHLKQSDVILYDNKKVHQFLQEHVLHWLEALGWMSKISEGIRAILSLESQISFDRSPNLHAFVHDAKRFALYNQSILEQAPLQIYCSTLVFAPQKSIIRRQFERCVPDWIQRKPRVQEYWSAALLTFEGHFGPVESVAFSPDGKSVVSGSRDRTVRFWDSETGAARQILEGHVDDVWSVAFSPDGKLVISGSGDKTVRLWDSETGAAQQIFEGGAVRQILEGHSSWVTSAVFSLDGKLVVSGSLDRMVRVWDSETGAAWHILEGHSASVGSVALSPDGKLAVSGSIDGTVRLWDAKTEASQQTLEGHSSWVRSVAFSTDGKQVVSGSLDMTVRLWDAETGVERRMLKGHLGPVESVAFSPDDKLVISGSRDQTVQLWDAATGATQQILKGHLSWVTSVAFSPDGKLILSGSRDKMIRLWDAMTGATQQILQGHSNWVTSVAFSPDGKQVVSGSKDRTVRLWDFETGAAQQILEGHVDDIWSVAFSPDSKLVVSGSGDQIVRLWNAETGAERQTLKGGSKGGSNSVSSVAFSPGGNIEHTL